MNRIFRSTLAASMLAVATFASGCFTMNAALPGALRSDVDAADTEKVGTLSHEATNYYFVYGLLGAPEENIFVDPILSQVKQKGGDGVANLKQEAQFGCVDLAIGAVTFGCVYPRSYKVTGDIVRIKKPALPGKPLEAKAKSSKTAQAPQGTTPEAPKTAQAF